MESKQHAIEFSLAAVYMHWLVLNLDKNRLLDIKSKQVFHILSLWSNKVLIFSTVCVQLSVWCNEQIIKFDHLVELIMLCT